PRTIAARSSFATTENQGLSMEKTDASRRDGDLAATAARIAAALERLSPPPAASLPPGAAADAYIWEPQAGGLLAVPQVSRVLLSLLKGIEPQRDTLLANTGRFADGLPANNALL